MTTLGEVAFESPGRGQFLPMTVSDLICVHTITERVAIAARASPVGSGFFVTALY